MIFIILTTPYCNMCFLSLALRRVSRAPVCASALAFRATLIENRKHRVRGQLIKCVYSRSEAFDEWNIFYIARRSKVIICSLPHFTFCDARARAAGA